MTSTTFKLNTGANIPSIAIGSWAPHTPEEQAKVEPWVSSALKAGYRHVDTGRIYLAEGLDSDGKGCREGDKRIWNPSGGDFCYDQAPMSSSDIVKNAGNTDESLWFSFNHQTRVAQSFQESLDDLGLDYVDLYLIHWPQPVAYEEGNWFPKNPDGTFKVDDTVFLNDTWAEMEKLVESGKAKAIGVSNFSIKTLNQLLKTAKVVPAVNQVELHPYLTQDALLEYCAEEGILVSAYASSGYENVRNDPVIIELAQKYGVSANQVTIGWHLSRNVIPVTKSENRQRQEDNLNPAKLCAEDVERITKLNRNERLSNRGENGSVFGWTYEQLGW